MYWNTLKIVTIIALLASPAALAAPGGIANPDGATSLRDTAPRILLADHRDGRRGDVRENHGRQPRFNGAPNRHFRPNVPPRFRGHPPPRFRGHPRRHFRGHPRRHFRGRPIRRHFRPWWRNWRRNY